KIQRNFARTADHSVPRVCGMGVYFLADFISWGIRSLYLAVRRVERGAISVGEELAVYLPALHRADRVRLYWLARLHATLADPRDVHVCGNGAAVAEPVGADVHDRGGCGVVVSSRRGHLEFSVQMGTGGDGTRATSGRAVGLGNRNRFFCVGAFCLP